MGCGVRAVSVQGGAADRKSYLAATGGFTQPPQKQKTNLTAENAPLNRLYAQVRVERESGQPKLDVLARVHADIEKSFPDDWLLRFELLELATQFKIQAPWIASIQARLQLLARTSDEKRELISRGLETLGSSH